MGRIGMEIQLRPVVISKQTASTAEEREDLAGEMREVLTTWLEDELEREADVETFEAMDGAAQPEISVDDTSVRFMFHDSYPAGAEACTHWYALAITACRDELDRLAAARGYEIENPREDLDVLVKDKTSRYLFVALGDELFGLSRSSGEIIGTEVVDIETLDAAYRKRLDEAAQDGLCLCELCERLRD